MEPTGHPVSLLQSKFHFPKDSNDAIAQVIYK